MSDGKKPNSVITPKLEPSIPPASPSRLGASLFVKGEISGHEDLLINGSVEGAVRLNESKLMIGPAANVKADIIAGHVVVRGNVKGNVYARNRIEIGNDGSVTGDLTTPQVLIEDGAWFKGSIEIESGTEKNAKKETAPSEKQPGPSRVAAAAAGADHI